MIRNPKTQHPPCTSFPILRQAQDDKCHGELVEPFLPLMADDDAEGSSLSPLVKGYALQALAWLVYIP
jgi:hypothetical protein